jgi:hypothetical protein
MQVIHRYPLSSSVCRLMSVVSSQQIETWDDLVAELPGITGARGRNGLKSLDCDENERIRHIGRGQ